MTRPQKNTLLACGVAAVLLSIPLPWMTISQPAGDVFFPGGSPGPGLRAAAEGMLPTVTADVTGLNGHVTLLFKVPLWLVALTAASACGVPLLAGLGAFDVPRWLPWAFAVPAGVWVAASLLLALTSDRATLGIGTLLAAAAVAAALIGLLFPARDPRETAGDPAAS